MPIAGEVPEPIQTEVTEQVQIVAKEYRSSLVDANQIKPETLLVQLDGFPWTVHYYSQYVGEDEELSPYQPGQLPVYQQYLEIIDMEIRVTSPLSVSQDELSNEMMTTGSAVMFPFMRPNPGDVFFADIGDGRTGLFVITTKQRKSLLKQTAYEVDYLLVETLDQTSVDQIKARVVKTVYFKKDLLANGQYPFLIESDHNAKQKMEDTINRFLKRYMLEFFSKEFSTFLVPGQPFVTYDHYMAKTMLKLFNPHEDPRLRKVKEYNIDGERIMDTLNIWDTILGMDNGLGGVVSQKMWLVSAIYFNSYPRLEGIRYSGIQNVVYPFLPLQPVDNGYRPYIEKDGTGYENIGDMDWDLISVIQNIETSGLTPGGDPLPPGGTVDTAEMPLIHPVLIDDYYVFSQNFYLDSETGQSALEVLTNNVIKNQAVNFNTVFEICDDINDWGKIERFYYMPVLMAIMKVLLRRL